MRTSKLGDWRAELAEAALWAKASVTGWRRVEYEQHARLLRTVILAFGDDPRASIFVEGLAPNTGIPRPDLILLHPKVGVLVVENKGITLEEVQGIHDTEMRLVRNGRLKDEDAFKQAEKVMYTLKDLATLRMDPREALFLRTAAFPRIRRSEMEQRFDCTFPVESLFSDACHDPEECREQIQRYSDSARRGTDKKTRLSQIAHDTLIGVLSGKSFFNSLRRARTEEIDPKLLGQQIQQLELALKDATQQQREHARADLRGAHRLFRGVAGSGKSIMLALSAAQTILLGRQEEDSLFDPEKGKRILVTCYNRSLVHYLRGKIEERLSRIAWDKPREGELEVVHFEGLVRKLEQENKQLLTGVSFDRKEFRAKLIAARFDKLPVEEQNRLGYDAVFVDEAQDLMPGELEFLRRLAKRDEKGEQTLLIFYDNAQNIYGVVPPTWSDLGINIVGRTVFLDQCLRNTRETLDLAFNMLVGSFAPKGLRVSTRQFADVGSLRQRGLVEEEGEAFAIRFAARSGPIPRVSVHASRVKEIEAIVEEIRRLIKDEQVLPSDILVLYNSHHPYKKLAAQLRRVIPEGYGLRQVDADHGENKNVSLLEAGFLTLSTIASAKGYDAPIVFFVGVDDLSTDEQGRARFYVGATRAKLLLYVSGVESGGKCLISEVLFAEARARRLVNKVSPSARPVRADEPSRFQDIAVKVTTGTGRTVRCRHCGSARLHCQQGGAGYYFLCIDCAAGTALSRRCGKCGEMGRVRGRGRNFVRVCLVCGFEEVVHTNVPLENF